MAKEKMVCPISKGLCVDCSIYRGRHYYLCFSKGYHGCLLESDEIEELKTDLKAGKDVKFGMPDDLRTSSKCLSNIEDIVINLDMQTPSA